MVKYREAYIKLLHETRLIPISINDITNKHLEYLSPLGENIRIAELYLQNKVHSNPPTNARPIISANGCPVENISEFVNFVLQPFVMEQHSYKKDTSDFIRKIENIRVQENALIITLDYESMCTNVIHYEYMEAAIITISNSNKHQVVWRIKRISIKSF